jgi:multidrug efflux pump
MILSEISVKRPVFATVISLLLVVFGIISFQKIPLREYPDIDPPIVSIDTNYRGASASVVESRITELIEARIAGIEGIKSISSQSSDGRSRITIEFNINRDIEAATNDIRDRVSSISDNLPEEAEPPEVQKSNSDDDVILWLNLNGEGMSVVELTDYARRYLVDRFSSLDGVARIRIGGAKDKAMRIWIDKTKLAARGLTINDVENSLRRENLELPAGQIQSINQDFTVRMKRGYVSAEQFGDMVLNKSKNGYLTRLKDVAKVEVAPTEERGFFRGNGATMIGIGIIKQSKANTLEVARAAKKKMLQVNESLPENMKLENSYDTSVFIDSSINEVYKTLVIAIILVILVIYIFLGSIRAMIIPVLTVPISLISSFIVLFALGYTINLLTLLALVLAIGLVVDDAIVVLENIYRRIEMGESRLVAAYRGSKQVGFAVIATTLVLIAVFIPIAFLEGDIGRLFSEFAVAMAVGVAFSSFVALSLSVMLCSKILDKRTSHNKLTLKIDNLFKSLRKFYTSSLNFILNKPIIIFSILIITIIGSTFLFNKIPSEFVPKEDRGVIFLIVKGPEGSSYNYAVEYMNEIEKRLTPFVDSGEFHRLLIRTPKGFGATTDFNGGIGIIVLKDWSQRKPINYYVGEIRKRTSDLAGVFVFPIVRQALGGGANKPIQFVLGGPSYRELANWRDILMEEASKNPKIIGLDYDYKETKPQISLIIKKDRAGQLGVNSRTINQTLETLLGSKRVTTYIEDGEEYDVLLEIDKSQKRDPSDIKDIYVRSDMGNLVQLSNLVELKEFADASTLNRYNKIRSITFEGNLADGYPLAEALKYLENIVRKKLPSGASIDYKGESLDYKESGSSIYFTFIMALIVVYLVMAAQFESFVHPFVIMFTVPFAIVGALIGLFLFGQSLNIYSQIGLIMLIGLAVKNGILIVEFINQLRDEGMEFKEAIIEASGKRLRPIIMTSFTTIVGSIPLIFSFGAGSETRYVIGIVILFGVFVTTFFTIYVIPSVYYYLAKNTSSPRKLEEKLEFELKECEDRR